MKAKTTEWIEESKAADSVEIPTKIYIVKTGNRTQIISADPEMGPCEIVSDIAPKIKMDMSSGKIPMATITFQAIIEDVVMVEPQLQIFPAFTGKGGSN